MVIYTCAMSLLPIYYLCTLTTLHVFNIYRTYHTLQWYHTLQGAKKNDQVDLLIQYHTQQTYISYIPYLPSTQYQPFMHTFHTYHTYQTYHTFQTCHTRPAIHTIHTQQHTIPHPHTTAGEGHYYGRPMTMAEGGVGTLDYIIIIYIVYILACLSTMFLGYLFRHCFAIFVHLFWECLSLTDKHSQKIGTTFPKVRIKNSPKIRDNISPPS